MNVHLLYDDELEGLVQLKALEILPLVNHLIVRFPDAAWDDIVYTLEEHIAREGIQGIPDKLMKRATPLDRALSQAKKGSKSSLAKELSRETPSEEKIITTPDVDFRKLLKEIGGVGRSES